MLRKTEAKRRRPRCEGFKYLNWLQDRVLYFGLYNIRGIRVDEEAGDNYCTGTASRIRSVAEAERRSITY
jgi:hypothetical protein